MHHLRGHTERCLMIARLQNLHTAGTVLGNVGSHVQARRESRTAFTSPSSGARGHLSLTTTALSGRASQFGEGVARMCEKSCTERCLLVIWLTNDTDGYEVRTEISKIGKYTYFFIRTAGAEISRVAAEPNLGTVLYDRVGWDGEVDIDFG